MSKALQLLPNESKRFNGFRLKPKNKWECYGEHDALRIDYRAIGWDTLFVDTLYILQQIGTIQLRMVINDKHYIVSLPFKYRYERLSLSELKRLLTLHYTKHVRPIRDLAREYGVHLHDRTEDVHVCLGNRYTKEQINVWQAKNPRPERYSKIELINSFMDLELRIRSLKEYNND